MKSIKWSVRPVYIRFFLTLFTAAVIMNLVYLAYYSYNARKLDETERTRVLNQTEYYVNRYMKEVEDGANMLTISTAVQRLLPNRIRKNYLDYANCAEVLTQYAMTIPGVYRIDLYTDNNSTLLTSYEGVFYGLKLEENEVYKTYFQFEENSFWDMHYEGKEPRLVSQNRNRHYISLIKPVFSKYTGKKCGVLCMSVELSELERLIPMENTKEEGIYLSYKGEPLSDRLQDTKDLRLLSVTSDYSGMVFDYYYPQNLLMKNSMPLILSMVIIISFFVIIFFCIVEISEKKMFYPVTTLLAGFKEIEIGNFYIQLDVERKDLFREIFSHFNHMAETLRQMITELSNERTRRNEFKFSLLQMQIKPHFLYNLFNNMIWMMEQKDYEHLEILIQSTAGYYKTALNYGSQDIMLAENKKQLEYYAEIQKIRFGDVFSFQVDFPEEAAYLSIPNLLLQPLVENSIVHGLKGKNEISHIKVSAEIENELLKISVWDDGCGICVEQLEDIRCEMKNYEGDGSKYFALVNITARLYNRYRERAFIRIDSQEGTGTNVVIGIPMDEVS